TTTTTMTGFEWPWQYSFPPFFTLQPNADVRRTQLDAWCALVVSWGRNNNVSQIDVTEASSLPVFKNPSISRSLPADSIMVVLEELAKRGNLEWMDKTKRRPFVMSSEGTCFGEVQLNGVSRFIHGLKPPVTSTAFVHCMRSAKVMIPSIK
ncbi:hypothetical protein OTU49_006037, partial [Cherax quadricarinatus]